MKATDIFPACFSRHLPMIAAQLRGRVHLKSKEFTNQQHLLMFSHILGLLDLLRPRIFKQDKVCDRSQCKVRPTNKISSASVLVTVFFFTEIQIGCK